MCKVHQVGGNVLGEVSGKAHGGCCYQGIGTQRTYRERRGRAGRAEQRETRGCLELLNSSQPPGQNLRLPEVLRILCSALGTAHPIHVLCRASCPYPTHPLCFPGGRVYRYKQIKIYSAFPLKHHPAHGAELQTNE